MIGWETQILDSDFDFLINKSNNLLSDILGRISLANNSWIENRCKVMKYTKASSFCTFGSISLLNKDCRTCEYSESVGTLSKLIKNVFYYPTLSEVVKVKNKLNIID